MTHIFERVLLHCPYAKARRYVHDEALGLVPNIPPFTLHLEHAVDPLRFDECLRVQWTPKPGAPYPEFVGEIALRMDTQSGNVPVLELRGEYLPPFGIPGRAFDLFVGAKLASTTAKSVLRSMADAIERAA